MEKLLSKKPDPCKRIAGIKINCKFIAGFKY